jgi:hypothetical protein
VAIGDLHGDLAKTTEAFRAGGLIDGSGAWIGGSTVAVQVGDQLDRGGDEVAILHMLERLRKEARDAGGELIVMNGNHETLNVAGRFRYAFEPGVEDFRRWRGRQLMGAALKAKCGEKPGGCTIVGAAQAALAVDRKAEKNGEPPIRGTTGLKDVPAGAASGRLYADTGSGCTMPRLAALAPGGPMAIRFPRAPTRRRRGRLHAVRSRRRAAPPRAVRPGADQQRNERVDPRGCQARPAAGARQRRA